MNFVVDPVQKSVLQKVQGHFPPSLLCVCGGGGGGEIRCCYNPLQTGCTLDLTLWESVQHIFLHPLALWFLGVNKDFFVSLKTFFPPHLSWLQQIHSKLDINWTWRCENMCVTDVFSHLRSIALWFRKGTWVLCHTNVFLTRLFSGFCPYPLQTGSELDLTLWESVFCKRFFLKWILELTQCKKCVLQTLKQFFLTIFWWGGGIRWKKLIHYKLDKTLWKKLSHKRFLSPCCFVTSTGSEAAPPCVRDSGIHTVC